MTASISGAQEKSPWNVAIHVSGLLLTPVLLLAAACSSKFPGPADAGTPFVVEVHDIEVAAPEYHGAAGHPLEAACRDWQLSPSQVQAFFRLSESYQDSPYNRFYQVGCGISGRLQAEGRHWHFAINGGGIATWQDGDTVRHFGCSARECEALLLLPSDGMEPD